MNIPSTPLYLVSLAAAAIACGSAHAGGTADQITVNDAYIRQAPPGAMAAGAFMVIRNSGSKEARIVTASNPASRVTELHTHLNEGGVMKMRQVKDIPVPAGGEAVLKPGGLHVMLIDLKAPLKDGDMVPIVLGMADGSSKEVAVQVRNPMKDAAASKADMIGHKH